MPGLEPVAPGTEVAEAGHGESMARRLAEAWLASQRSPRTQRTYGLVIGRWLDWCDDQGVDPLAAFGVHVEAWTREMGAEHELGETTLALHHAALASFYRYAGQADGRGELVARNPLASVRRIKVARAGLTPALTTDDVRAILAEARKNPRDEVLLTLLAMTGARVAEVAAARVADLDVDGSEHVLRVIRKGRGRQSLVLSPAVAELAHSWITRRQADASLGLPAGPNDPLVPSLARRRRGGWMSAKTASAVVARLISRALGMRRGGHSLRVTAATVLSDVLPMSAIQEQLGHADVATTQRYVRRGRRLDDGRTAAGVLGQRYGPSS